MSKTLQGKIIKGIGGFYYVDTDEGLIECRARGKFRYEGITPLVGDNVLVADAYVIEVLPRKSELIRPKVANTDKAIIVFSPKDPSINFEALDKFLILALAAGIEAVICINKCDLDKKGVIDEIRNIYANSGCNILSVSAKNSIGIDGIKKELYNVTTVFAGPSGVGKSSIINLAAAGANLKTGGLSKKNKRGKHTTREAVLIPVDGGGYVIDTPGFTSLSLDHIRCENLADYFYEFNEFKKMCKFTSCSHTNESAGCCAVKAAVGKQIHIKRYERYERLYSQLAEVRYD